MHNLFQIKVNLTVGRHLCWYLETCCLSNAGFFHTAVTGVVCHDTFVHGLYNTVLPAVCPACTM